MLQLKNGTPFAATMIFLPDETGVDTLYLTVKATFDIGSTLRLSDLQLPPQDVDIYWGEAGLSSLRYASDNHLGKLSTDIVMMGDAYAPKGMTVTWLDVGLQVGGLQKSVRVFGDRCWRDGGITPPEPFVTMPMVYERAFGGAHLQDGISTSSEMRNPVGRGYTEERDFAAIDGLLLPNLENPSELITGFMDRPAPACFGFSAPHWHPRAMYAGSYDDLWKRERAPYLPDDFDKRFFNMAHPDLVCPDFLQGGEAVKITHMHPDGDLVFDLPRVRFSVMVDVAGVIDEPLMNLETLIMEPNLSRISMVWKGRAPCDKKGLKIGSVKIGMQC